MNDFERMDACRIVLELLEEEGISSHIYGIYFHQDHILKKLLKYPEYSSQKDIITLLILHPISCNVNPNYLESMVKSIMKGNESLRHVIVMDRTVKVVKEWVRKLPMFVREGFFMNRSDTGSPLIYYVHWKRGE